MTILLVRRNSDGLFWKRGDAAGKHEWVWLHRDATMYASQLAADGAVRQIKLHHANECGELTIIPYTDFHKP